MSLRLLSDVEREVLLDALSEYLNVSASLPGERLSTAERLYHAIIADGAMALDEADR